LLGPAPPAVEHRGVPLGGGERQLDLAIAKGRPLRGDDHGGAVVYVDGQIDRVDVSADRRRARVVDYKTGRLPAAEDHGKSAFQLPLYAAVVARALGCEAVEAGYVSVRPRGIVEEQPRAAEDRRALGAQRDEIAGAARRVILSMWKGDVPPRPAKATLCAHCDVRDVCRRPAVAPIEEA
jgi:ATP-dependent helicase/nuclease subunit B